MNPRLINTAWVGLIVLILCAICLLDGPSELEAMRATADSKQDAIKSAAAKAIKTTATAQKEHKTVVAGVQP